MVQVTAGDPAAQDEEAKESERHMFDDLTSGQKERLAKVIMEFEDAQICPGGRRQFLVTYGFPTPPLRGTVTVYLEFDMERVKMTDSGYIRDEEVGRREKEILAALEPLGYRIDSRSGYITEFDTEEED